MARLWTCGFELQDASATPKEWLSSTGTPTISTTVHRAGAASLRINPTAATQYVEQQLDSGTVKRTLHRFYLRITTLPSADCNLYGIGQSGFFPGLLRLKTTGVLTLRDGFTSADIGTTSAALSTGVWHRIELDYTDVAGTAGSFTGAFKGYLNGVEFSSTLCSNTNGWSRVRIGAQTAVSADLHIDDVAVNDTTGSVQTGLPGPGNVVHLAPNAAGDNAGWATTVGGTSNWQRVSEITPDDATTYNATVATGTTTIDDHNLSSTATAGVSGERVTLVQVGGRIGSNAVTAASLVYRIKSQTAGTVLESASVSVALNGWATHKAAAPFIQQLTSYTDPQAGGAWTTALLDQAQIGYRSNVSQTTARRVSALWALVETIPITTTALTLAAATEAAQPLARRKTITLGVATETSTARILGQPIAQLKDSFDDNTVDTAKWPSNYNTAGAPPTEAGGRAVVPCGTGYAAYGSAYAWTLQGSQLSCRLYPAALSGATTECWSQVLIQTATAGTDVTVEYNAPTGTLAMAVRVGYNDPGYTAIAYDPVAHAYIRIREASGNLHWETSPDGSTWTIRRTATAPAWVAEPGLQVQLISHRSDGVANAAEYDSLNISTGQTAALTVASETDTGQSLTRLKSRTLPIASESTAAQPAGKTKTKALGTAVEADAGQTLPRRKQKALAPAGSSETAQPLARSKRKTVGVASTTQSAQALAGRKTEGLALVGETDAARPLAGTKRLALGPAGETSSARPAVGGKTRALGRASETVTALLLAPSSGMQAAEETSAARPLARSKRTVLGVASESAAARPLGSLKSRALLPGAESATSLPLGGGKARALAPAVEAWTARPLTGAKARALTTAGETSSARVLTGTMAGVLGAAQAVDTARPLAGGKRLTVGAAAEVSSARIGPYYRLAVAVETVQALALVGSRQQPADRLTAGTSGPVLTADTDGPVLVTSSSGPSLSASVTSGGG